MKRRHSEEVDSAKKFLEQIAADRGVLITDEEYAGLRAWRLEVLSRPPRIEWSIAFPGLASMLAGVGSLVAAWVTWVRASADTTMSLLMFGIVLAGLGSYFFFGNLRACRAEANRPCSERKTEIDDLLRSGLISAQEHETLRQAIVALPHHE